MGFSVNATARDLAQFRVSSVGAQATIGGYQLLINVAAQIRAVAEEHTVVMQDWTLVVNAGATGASAGHVGTARSESPLAIRSYKYDHDQQITFRLELTPHKLAALEELRGGRELTLQLQVYALGRPALGSDAHEATPHLLHDTLNHTIGLTEWLQRLEELHYSKQLVFTMEIPDGPKGTVFAETHALLVRARTELLRAEYENVVFLARKVMESLSETTGERDVIGHAMGKFRGDKLERESMSKPERAMVVQEAVRHLSHLAVHAGTKSAVFSRNDALNILGIANSVFSIAVARFDERPAPTAQRKATRAPAAARKKAPPLRKPPAQS